MGNAKYIGRVGALAVALGIGTAVATTPWVAVAEPAADSSSASDASSNASNLERIEPHGVYGGGRLEISNVRKHFGWSSQGGGHRAIE